MATFPPEDIRSPCIELPSIPLKCSRLDSQRQSYQGSQFSTRETGGKKGKKGQEKDSRFLRGVWHFSIEDPSTSLAMMRGCLDLFFYQR